MIKQTISEIGLPLIQRSIDKSPPPSCMTDITARNVSNSVFGAAVTFSNHTVTERLLQLQRGRLDQSLQDGSVDMQIHLQ